jgi:hypothetical protein
MTMLFLMGISAVMFLVVFGMWETVARGNARSARLARQAEAAAIADAGLAFAGVHSDELRRGGVLRRACGAGAFEVTVVGDGGTSWVVSSASVPAERPLAVVEARQPWGQ